MKHSKFFQRLLDLSIGKRRIPVPKAPGIALRIYNKLALNKKYSNNYLITEKIGKHDLLLPLNHRLPWTFKKNPLYSRNLGRINRYICALYPEYTIIDIGANIGDSAFLLRETDERNSIVCVEGNPEYLPLLAENLKKLGKVTIVKSFVGHSSGENYGELVSDGRGTTFVRPSEAGDLVRFMSLNDIIDECKIANKVGLLKIDTDGYDCQIIKGNMGVIKEYKPVLFFEYAPAWFPGGKDSQYDIFSFLSLNEYHYFIFYDGVGNYLISSGPEELHKISKEMHFHYSCGTSFGDIAAFHKDDVELFQYAVEQEKTFYEKYFGA